MAEKYRPLLEAKAKINLETPTGGKNATTLQNSAESIDTREQLSKIANVSHDTYSKARTVLNSGNEEIKQKALSGEMSVNAAMKMLQVI